MEQRKDDVICPLSIEPETLHEVGLLTHAYASEQRDRRLVPRVDRNENTVLVKFDEQEFENSLNNLGGVALMLVRRSQCNANFALAWLVLQEMKAAITNDLIAGPLNYGKLEPGIWRIHFDAGKGFNEYPRPFERVGLPTLIPRHLRIRAIGEHRVCVSQDRLPKFESFRHDRTQVSPF